MDPRRRITGLAALAIVVLCVPHTGHAGSAYDHLFTAIDGGELPLDQYRGKTLLVVNTASFCGFTRQYDDLQSLWARYRDRGLIVLGVPSNDFGNQEPGSEAEIKEFCEVNFAVDFPLTAKEHVVGADAHPFYVWARRTRPEFGPPLELPQVPGLARGGDGAVFHDHGFADLRNRDRGDRAVAGEAGALRARPLKIARNPARLRRSRHPQYPAISDGPAAALPLPILKIGRRLVYVRGWVWIDPPSTSQRMTVEHSRCRS